MRSLCHRHNTHVCFIPFSVCMSRTVLYYYRCLVLPQTYTFMGVTINAFLYICVYRIFVFAFFWLVTPTYSCKPTPCFSCIYKWEIGVQQTIIIFILYLYRSYCNRPSKNFTISMAGMPKLCPQGHNVPLRDFLCLFQVSQFDVQTLDFRATQPAINCMNIKFLPSCK